MQHSTVRTRALRLLAAGMTVATLTVGVAAGAARHVRSPQPAARPAGARAATVVDAVGAENEYADVIGQIGGRYVHVAAIMSNPNTDPHEFEASPAVSQEVASARLVVQNGVGYDTFMSTVEKASPNGHRDVIDVQHLLGLSDSTPNPHLWYEPSTMPVVAKAIAADLSAIDPAARSVFAANLKRFDASLAPWNAAIASLKAAFPHATAAVTEPVGDYLLEAAGFDVKTPFGLQADIMNGVDPSPQDITLEENLFSRHEVKVFVYNQQVVDSLTATFLAIAEKNHIPVVGVYETMPTPGYDYQSWMLAEVKALHAALADHRSTEKL